eukprot:GCRY01004249.1.p1 GENE.GCRY01004249.1~~GCRY01004249.1.p1  ORF type:complete len:319 (+),score=67.45 GCRY01004249.1:186-1142(+)
MSSNIEAAQEYGRKQYKPLSETEEYRLFRSTIPLKKVAVDDFSSKNWQYFDHGPKDCAEPVIFFPGASGTCSVFYNQMMSLSALDYRVVAVQHPPYFSIKDFVRGFDRFLLFLGVRKVHLVGTSLGGFLVQHYCWFRPERVASMFLINAFCDNTIFNKRAGWVSSFAFQPRFMLQKTILESFPQYETEIDITRSLDFMVEQLDTLNQQDLASRLTLNCSKVELEPPKIDSTKVTVLCTLDEVSVPERMRLELLKYYPDCKEAYLKDGGNFCYLSRPDEVSMFIKVHLRRVAEELKEEEELNRQEGPSHPNEDEAEEEN